MSSRRRTTSPQSPTRGSLVSLANDFASGARMPTLSQRVRNLWGCRRACRRAIAPCIVPCSVSSVCTSLRVHQPGAQPPPTQLLTVPMPTSRLTRSLAMPSFGRSRRFHDVLCLNSLQQPRHASYGGPEQETHLRNCRSYHMLLCCAVRSTHPDSYPECDPFESAVSARGGAVGRNTTTNVCLSIGRVCFAVDPLMFFVAELTR